jgi:myo-inositol 2-dehydrogenase / D-chiro-inositol 1-dehydrogenase
MTTKNQVKVGIIGAGRIGRVHAETLAYRIPTAKVEMISDVRIDAAKKAASDFGIPKAVEDYHEILASKDIHAVIICSSTDTHARIIEEACAAGKHIFCEKPIDLTLEKIQSALAAVKKSGVKFQVGFNRRYDPNFKKVADSVKAGAIGQPQIVKITSRDPGPPPADYVKVSGGMFLDMTIHDFDMARYVIADEPEEVFVYAGNLVDPAIKAAGDVDTAVVTMRYKSGAMCVIDNSRKAVYGYDQRIEVFGSKGCLTSDNNTPTRTHYWNETGQHQDLPLHFFLQRYTESYAAEMVEFIDCIENNKTPTCGGFDGLQSVVLGMAARKSWQERRPVKVEEILK